MNFAMGEDFLESIIQPNSKRIRKYYLFLKLVVFGVKLGGPIMMCKSDEVLDGRVI